MHGSAGEMRTAKRFLASISTKCFLVITFLPCEHLPYTGEVIHGHGAPQMTEKTNSEIWYPTLKQNQKIKKPSSFKVMG